MGRLISFIILSVSLFSFIPQTSLAQPGGGGGLVIKGLYAKYNQPIDWYDEALEVRSFMLKDSMPYTDVLSENINQPPNKLPPNYQDYYQSYRGGESNQRMLINYKNDVMVIDFIGIWGENGAGVVDHMDSLVFQPGYFRYYRDPNLLYTHIDRTKVAFSIRRFDEYPLLEYGLTPHSIQGLSKIGWLEKWDTVDLSFLKK